MESILALPSHIRRRLAQALESGILTIPCSRMAARSALGIRNGGEDVMAVLCEMERLGMSGKAAAAWIRSIEEVSQRTPQPDLVWSGPEVPGVNARDTRQVFDELLSNAKRSVWISTYAYFDGPRAFELLAKRMETLPDLKVNILLNVQRKRGDTESADVLVRRFADRFWVSDWPGTARPGVYYDPRSLDTDKPGGVLHAKAVITDDEAVFITSANLTEAAFDRNFELGLLVRDRALALMIASHFRILIDRGLLSSLPLA